MSMFKRILIPVDGSAPSDAAVDLGIIFAADQHAELGFVHVCDMARMAALVSGAGMVATDPSPMFSAEREFGQALLHSAVEKAAARAGAHAMTFYEEGGCVDAILGVAERWNADLIIVGSHGRGGIARALLGSVAEGVLRRARVPVLVMHVGNARPARPANGEVAQRVSAAASVSGTPHEVDPIC